MFDPVDLDDATRWVDEWQTGFEQRTAQANELSRRVAEISGTVRSPNGLVTVTVDGSARLTELRLDDRIRRLAAPEIAKEIQTTIEAAYADVVERVRQATAETVGADSEIGRAVVSSFTNRLTPTRDEDDGGESWRWAGSESHRGPDS